MIILKNILHKLLIAALAFATISPFTLDAMKRKREDSFEETENGVTKKRRLEAKTIKLIITKADGNFIANDGKKIDGKKHSVIQGLDLDKIELFGTQSRKIISSFNFAIYNFFSITKMPEKLPINQNEYPLEQHKQLTDQRGNYQLKILRYRNANDKQADKSDADAEFVEIKLPEEVAKRMLKYFYKDFSDISRDCFDFVNHVLWDSKKNKAELQYETINDINSVKPGNEVVLLSERSLLPIKYFAIALGNNLFISKFLAGGPLLITDKDFLTQSTKLDRFAKIKK